MKLFDKTGQFLMPTDNDGDAIRRLTVRGAGATVFGGGLTLAIQICATVVLARILSPADFGVVAMVTTFTLLLVNFGFNGLTEALVQREDVTHALASSVFWINVGCGALLTLAFASAGSLLARFYHHPPVKEVAVGLSLTIFATSISTVHLALLKRAMRFSAVTVNDVCARCISVLLSIYLGWIGWGYWALVAGTVSIPVSTSFGAWFLCRWMPGFPRRTEGLGATLKFALHTYGNFAVNYMSRNTDNLLVGWRFDAQSLGFYKKAYDLFALTASQFVGSIAVVVVAGLSRAKKDSALYRRYLLNAIAVMAFVGMGLGAGLTLVGKDLILVLLGPKWNEAGQIFTFFGPGIGVMILYNTHGWIHLSVGRPDRWLRWAIFEFVVTCSLFVAGLHWGPIGVATAWSVSFWILGVPAIWYAGIPISLGVTPIVSTVWKFVAASLVAVGGTTLSLKALPALATDPHISGALLRMGFVCVVATPLYGGVVVLLHGGLAPLRQIADLIGEVIGNRGTPKEVQAGQLNAVISSAAGSAPGGQPAPNRLPLVSILIPAYNAESWIGDTLRSALAQTWAHTEIIVVDDGSSDDTLAIARQFEARGVRVIAQENQGASAARNHAFSVCHGDYIQWLDADDLLAPDKIEQQMNLVIQGLDPCVLLSSAWAHFMYRPWRAQFKPSALWCDLPPQEWLMRKMERNIFMQTATWLVSRELTEAAGPWDIRLLGDDDGEYFCRVLMASSEIRFVPDAKVYYRAFRFDGLSYIGRYPKKIVAHWISMQLHIRYLRSMGDTTRARAACLQFLRDSLIYFYPERTDILAEAENLAAELGESLGVPVLSWKYSWLEVTLGWRVVKPVQRWLRKYRWRGAKQIDHLLFRLTRRTTSFPFTVTAPENRRSDKSLLSPAGTIEHTEEVAS